MSHLVGKIVVGLFLLGGSIATCMVAQADPGRDGETRDEAAAASDAALDQIRFTPSRIEGHDKCVACHKQEVQSWLQTKHATRAFDLLRTTSAAQDYAEALGIRPADLARSSRCLKCHATRQVDSNGRAGVIAGISCEACHGGAGGEDGWFNAHAAYGPRGTRREQESLEHYNQRRQRCGELGQIGSGNLYLAVRRCFQCHIVDDEALAEAGHEHGDGFQLVERLLGEVRHNFLLNPDVNNEAPTLWLDALRHRDRSAAGYKRVITILGQMADLEICLRNLATATSESNFTDQMFDRIEQASKFLAENVLEKLRDTKVVEVNQTLEALKPVLHSHRSFGFDPSAAAKYVDAADAIQRAATNFSRRDGSDLKELDALDVIPVGPFQRVYRP